MRPLASLAFCLALAGCNSPAETPPAADLAITPPPDLGASPSDLAASPPDLAPAPVQLWFYLGTNLQVNANVTAANALIDRAAAAGYTGMVLADFKLGILQTGIPAAWYVPNVKMVLDHAAQKNILVVPQIFDIGHSDTLMYVDPNYGEGMPVIGAKFTVSNDGLSLALNNSLAPLADGGFERHQGNQFTGWDWQDARVVADSTTFHGGGVSARIDPGAGNGRVVKALAVQPNRQYHVRGWLKTSNMTGFVNVMLYDTKIGRARNQWNGVPHQSTQGWTQFDFVANSADSTALSLYAGVWGDTPGTAWFDDVTVEEVGLVNVIRRPGAPLRVSDGGGTVYTEGTDYNPIADPMLAKGGAITDWHTPPTVTLPRGGRLKPGMTVTIDYYAVQPALGDQVAVCLSEPAVRDELKRNFDALAPIFGAGRGWFLSYDELRQGNTCAACAARNTTAGALLADHLASTIDLIRKQQPNAPLYIWSDMFDPLHNAVDNYYLVKGTLAESWKGLPSDVVVMNWNLGANHSKSLAFFAGRGNPQIIAGYYDSGDGAKSAQNELNGVRGTAGLLGLMYTTWRGDFSQLENYAKGAREAW